MADKGTGEPCWFLGDPKWEPLPGGRVRCVQTGHEMPIAAQATYGTTKKCRSALFEAALARGTPPLNFFEQSPLARDKIICKLTGVLLNKKEEAVWKHMLGRKFEQKLEEIEAEKERARMDVEMTETSFGKLSSRKYMEVMDSSCSEVKFIRKKKEKTIEALPEEVTEEDRSSDECEFWVPPPGDRWDFDNGSDDRWALPPYNDSRREQKFVGIHGNSEASVKNGSEFDQGDTEMLNGDTSVDDACSNDNESKIRIKRTSSASASRSQKRRAKQLKAESSRQKGV